MSVRLGTIALFNVRGYLQEEMTWTPSEISRESRKAIVEKLREIADNMEQDKFLDKGEYKFFKAPLDKSAKE